MSKADEMFEKLGYSTKKSLLDKKGEQWGVKYINFYLSKYINFDFIDKSICISDEDNEPIYFTVEELLAINEKCKELGWLE